MSAVPKTKVYEKLRPFMGADGEAVGGDSGEASLDNLDVFHPDFSQIEDLPRARQVNKTYEHGLEEGRALAEQEGALHHREIQELAQSLAGNIAALGVQIEASHRRAINSIIRAVLPNLAEQAAAAEISKFVTEISGQALSGHVDYTVSSAYKPKLQAIVEALEKTGVSTPEFSIEECEHLVGAAVNAKWRSGGGSIDIDGAAAHCLSLLEDKSN